MATSVETFQKIYSEFPEKYDGVTQGNMMRADALKVNGKVFCFFYEENMCFKLGKNANPERSELADAWLLSPFKNKPPMKGWFVVPFSDAEIWVQLAEEAMLVVGSGK